MTKMLVSFHNFAEVSKKGKLGL